MLVQIMGICLIFGIVFYFGILQERKQIFTKLFNSIKKTFFKSK